MRAWLIVLLAGVLPGWAAAGDENCLSRLRSKLVESEFGVSAETLNRLSIGPTELRRAARQASRYTVTSKSLGREHSGLRFSFHKAAGSYRMYYDAQIGLPANWAEGISYTLTVTTFVVDEATGKPVTREALNYKVMKGCQVAGSGGTSMQWTYSGAGHAAIDYSTHTSGRAPDRMSVTATERQVISGAGLAVSMTAEDLVHWGLRTDGGKALFPDPSGLYLIKARVEPSRKTARMGGREQVLAGAVLIINDDGPEGFRFHYLRKSDGLDVRISQSGGEEYWAEEDVPPDVWSATKLVSVEENEDARVNGFSESDFYASSLVYDLKFTRAFTPFENSGAYFTMVKTENGYRVYERPVETPRALPLSAPAGAEDLRYLRTSRYLDPGAVATVIAELKTRTAGMDRLQASVAVIKKIGEMIEYDHGQLSNDTVEPMGVEEIVRRGKGVCQHYAALFLTIARALGIPARMVSGFYAETGRVIYHAWIEIKVNDTTWWPLEPQDPSARLRRRTMVPLMVTEIYEEEAFSAEGRTKVMLSIANGWKPMLGAEITKVHAP